MPEEPVKQSRLFLWQALAVVGLLVVSMTVFYFRYLRLENGPMSHWPLFNWITAGLLAVMSFWAGPGIAKLIVGYTRHKASLAPDEEQKHHQRRRVGWFDWQMADASWLAIVALTIITNGIALIVGIYGLQVCKHPKARQKAATMTILGGCLTVIGVVWALVKYAPQ